MQSSHEELSPHPMLSFIPTGRYGQRSFLLGCESEGRYFAKWTPLPLRPSSCPLSSWYRLYIVCAVFPVSQHNCRIFFFSMKILFASWTFSSIFTVTGLLFTVMYSMLTDQKIKGIFLFMTLYFGEYLMHYWKSLLGGRGAILCLMVQAALRVFYIGLCSSSNMFVPVCCFFLDASETWYQCNLTILTVTGFQVILRLTGGRKTWGSDGLILFEW